MSLPATTSPITPATADGRAARPELVLTHEDMARLRALVERHLDGPESSAADALEAELDRAQVVARHDMPPDVVTMRSRVLFEDLETGERREVAVVYPEESTMERSMVSVLAPVGTALLGLSRGQSIVWPVPGSRTRTLKVVDLLYQPEAAGDLGA